MALAKDGGSLSPEKQKELFILLERRASGQVKWSMARGPEWTSEGS